MSVHPGINIGNSNITDLVYADDTALLLPSVVSSCSTRPGNFTGKDKAAKLNWVPVLRPQIYHLVTCVETVDSFVYLGCLQSSSGQCRSDLKRRIGFASSTMSSLSRIWKDKRCVSSPVCGGGMDITGRRFEVSGSLSYETVSSHTGLASGGEQIASRRVAIFGHIARLGEDVPAHQALRAHVNLSLGRLPGRDWKHRPGQAYGSIRFVTTPATCPRRYGAQPFSVAMAQQ